MNYYKCGKILTTHGIKGDLKILPMTDFLRFFNGNTLYVLHNNEYIMVKLKDVKEFQGNLYLLKFDGTPIRSNREDVYNRDGYIICNRLENFLL